MELHIKILMVYLMECYWGNNMVFKNGFDDGFVIGLLLG